MKTITIDLQPQKRQLIKVEQHIVYLKEDIRIINNEMFAVLKEGKYLQITKTYKKPFNLNPFKNGKIRETDFICRS
jgi:hypothetical protein